MENTKTHKNKKEIKINNNENSQKDLFSNGNIKDESSNEKVLEDLNFFHIISSCYCCNNEKEKLVTLWHD